MCLLNVGLSVTFFVFLGARGAVPNASVGLRPPPATRLPAPAFTAGETSHCHC